MARITEKRKLKGYKIRESIYKKAMRRANKEKISLAPKIEEWVTAYAGGQEVRCSLNFVKDPQIIKQANN